MGIVHRIKTPPPRPGQKAMLRPMGYVSPDKNKASMARKTNAKASRNKKPQPDVNSALRLGFKLEEKHVPVDLDEEGGRCEHGRPRPRPRRNAPECNLCVSHRVGIECGIASLARHYFRRDGSLASEPEPKPEPEPEPEKEKEPELAAQPSEPSRIADVEAQIDDFRSFCITPPPEWELAEAREWELSQARRLRQSQEPRTSTEIYPSSHRTITSSQMPPYCDFLPGHTPEIPIARPRRLERSMSPWGEVRIQRDFPDFMTPPPPNPEEIAAPDQLAEALGSPINLSDGLVANLSARFYMEHSYMAAHEDNVARMQAQQASYDFNGSSISAQ
ncbi:hypothetical protein BKA62DRAFT_760471 [Auriculariales sp. MPI-PUGE-AT-0066]|nr:hypothetical protein BKA62DRAFT_760471 [Auriculariales sp. MPI-PUGE-AT-0066]